MAAPLSPAAKVYHQKDEWVSDDEGQLPKKPCIRVPIPPSIQRAVDGVFGNPSSTLSLLRAESTRPLPSGADFGIRPERPLPDRRTFTDGHLAGVTAQVVRQGPPPTPRKPLGAPRPAVSRNSVLPPLQPKWNYQANGERILETIHTGQTIGSFEIQREFKKTGEFGRAFLAQILVGDGAGELRVLKFNVPHAKHGMNYLERTAFEFADYVKLKKIGFTDLATYYDFEPFIADPEVDRILSLELRFQNRAFQDFLKPKLSSGYHIVEFVEDAANVPIQVHRDVVTGGLSRVYKMDIPQPADADYPFWKKVKDNLKKLYDADIPSDYSIHNIGRSGKYFDLRPNETESASIEIPSTLKTYTLEGSDLYKWLDPREPSRDC